MFFEEVAGFAWGLGVWYTCGCLLIHPLAKEAYDGKRILGIGVQQSA